jgi:hypothetical protein
MEGAFKAMLRVLVKAPCPIVIYRPINGTAMNLEA